MAFDNNHSGADTVYGVNNYSTQNDYDQSFNMSDANIRFGDEPNFWSHSPKSESALCLSNAISNPYKAYSLSGHAFPRTSDQINHNIGELCHSQPTLGTGRVVKRRCTANKKERRRTQSINNAYADLRDCVPNVPADTKLSKIKTLRLATLYISYLIDILEMDDPSSFGAFRAELGPEYRKRQESECGNKRSTQKHNQEDMQECGQRQKASKGRTGWPQHVWASELKQDPSLP